MKIRIDNHTLQRAEERSASEEEIKKVIEKGISIKAKQSRLGKSKIFPFNDMRNKKYYAQKRVGAIYALEENTIVTDTVYVFYGKWDKET